MRSKIRKRRSAKRSRTPSQADVEAPSGRGAFERNLRKGKHDETSATVSAKNGTALLMAKSQVPMTGPTRCSVAASVPVRTPLAYSSESDATRSGTSACSEE